MPPIGVSAVHVTAIGAAGGGGCMTTPGGGDGAQITADIFVGPTTVLYVEVGGPGGLHPGICDYGANYAGWNGGGLGGPVAVAVAVARRTFAPSRGPLPSRSTRGSWWPVAEAAWERC